MAAQSLSVFQFHTHSLRVFATDDGLSFVAVAKDVADVLGYATAKDFLRQVPDSHKGRQKVPTPSGEQEMLVVDEAGLYRGVLRSNKPEAEPFMEWITAEVLPSIRHTGGYVREGAAQLQLATEVGKLRDTVAAQGEVILSLFGRLDNAQRGHIRAVTSLLNLNKRHAAMDAKATMLRMLAEGRPRDEIARATGRSLNHIRQIAFRARADGTLPELPADTTGDLFGGAA
ncbi:MAG: BRO family protein [Opitutaceae bacterium]|nr:BRO family protein [Opitutaceae bacterium]